MNLTGQQLIGSETVSSGDRYFHAVDPETGETLTPSFHEATAVEIDRAVRAAEDVFDLVRMSSDEQRATLLENIAEQLLSLGDQLLDRAGHETGLPRARLEGERGRTVGQLRMFAELILEGSWREVRIDRAQPEREPLPKPDLRTVLVALGPVGVFGASNFPLAFSVAGGDTASALAAGCPVVVKGHPAHPGTSELTGRAILAAVKESGFPDGLFSLIQGSSVDVGAALVQHPLLKAVAFTGSLKGGRALFDLAAVRPEPIPVYAEMGSVNPVFLLPESLQANAASVAEGFVGALTLGVGQFCTNPGLIVAQRGEGLDTFLQMTTNLLALQAPGTMLHTGIKRSFCDRFQVMTEIDGADMLVDIDPGATNDCRVGPGLLRVDAARWLAKVDLAGEVFGPASMVVTCADRDEMLQVARRLEGQLTASLHGDEQELVAYDDLARTLERKAGRIVFNGWPTGVEVCAAMNHGGPYPASTDARSTSVGTAAIRRFLRPVCYQNAPAGLLPDGLQDRNPRGLWRLLDGTLSRDDIVSLL